MVASPALGAQPPGAKAQPRPLSTVLSVDAVSLVRSTLQLEGERVLTEKLSVQLGVGLSLSASRVGREVPIASAGGFVTRRVEQGNTTGTVSLSPGVRYFLWGSAPEGLWGGLQLGGGVGRSLFDSRSDGVAEPSRITSLLTLGGDALVGYSLLLTRGFMLQAAVGMGAAYTTYEESSTLSIGPDDQPSHGPPSRTHRWDFGPTTRLALGWAF
ncbi:MAG TPA: DUF3575 domain-containing protein [Archangium sp.]|uniref:DUF3575 domain-containing protein n=1 Tax=Archangium sp. TaxID=1872627 RepID=UPI002E32819F|nr:DUF3575 domain-containing protein [Archangium sp.]HEX5751987.1 DUF3575 domain-containing protein [Archangium sp.]